MWSCILGIFVEHVHMNTNICPTVSSDNLANAIGFSLPEVCITSINPFVVSLLTCSFLIIDALSAGFSVFIDVSLVPSAGFLPNVYINWIRVVKCNKICAGSFSVSPLKPWLYFAVPPGYPIVEIWCFRISRCVHCAKKRWLCRVNRYEAWRRLQVC